MSTRLQVSTDLHGSIQEAYGQNKAVENEERLAHQQKRFDREPDVHDEQVDRQDDGQVHAGDPRDGPESLELRRRHLHLGGVEEDEKHDAERRRQPRQPHGPEDVAHDERDRVARLRVRVHEQHACASAGEEDDHGVERDGGCALLLSRSVAGVRENQKHGEGGYQRKDCREHVHVQGPRHPPRRERFRPVWTGFRPYFWFRFRFCFGRFRFRGYLRFRLAFAFHFRFAITRHDFSKWRHWKEKNTYFIFA